MQYTLGTVELQDTLELSDALMEVEDQMEAVEELHTVEADEIEVESTQSAYEYSTKKWLEVINKPAIQMI